MIGELILRWAASAIEAATARAAAPVATAAFVAGAGFAGTALAAFALRLVAPVVFAAFAPAVDLPDFVAAFTVAAFGFAAVALPFAAVGFVAGLAAAFVFGAAGFAATVFRFVAAEVAGLPADFFGAAVFLGAAGFAADFDTDFFKFDAAFFDDVETAFFADVLALDGGAFALTDLALDATEDLEEVDDFDVAARDLPAAPDLVAEAARFDEVALALVGLALVFAGPAFAEVLVFAAI